TIAAQHTLVNVEPQLFFPLRPSPNWSPTHTRSPSSQISSITFSECTGRPSSSVSVSTIFFVLTSITSPVDGQAYLPSRLNVLQPVCSRSLILTVCFGGIPVASKTCMLLLAASQTQTSVSSGVRPMPWLGQPCRLTCFGSLLKPCTSTRCSTLPVLRSP